MKTSSIRQSATIGFFKQTDFLILVPILVTLAIGLSVLSRLLAMNAAANYPKNMIVQGGSVLIGLVLMFTIMKIGVRKIQHFGWILYGLSLILQLLLPIFGDKSLARATGSNSWLRLPLIGSVQPSELAKVALFILVSYYLDAIKRGQYRYPRGFGYIACLCIPQLLLILGYQSDVGTAFVIILSLVAMLFVWGIKLSYIAITFSAFVFSLPIIWFYFLAEFRKKRIISFLYPQLDPQAAYNVNQAKRAILSGGLTGNKTGHFVHVPVQESDFIFTAVAEYMGLIGTATLVICLFAFIMRAIYVASRSRTHAERYMATGITTMFAVHTIQNIGMCLGFLPVTGIPLPFVSQGGTAMLNNCIAAGVLLAIASERYRWDKW